MPSRIRIWIAAALALAAALLLAAATCGGSDDDATETPSPTLDPAIEARARSYLLTLEDLPEGWTIKPPDSESGSDSEDPEYAGDIPSECEFFAEDELLAGTLTEVASDDFEDDVGSSLSSDATIMDDARVASDAFYIYKRLNRDCDSTIKDIFTFYLEQDLITGHDEDMPTDDAEITVLDTSYDEFDFPTYGDETTANRFATVVQYDAAPIPVNADIIAIRVGDAVVTFTYTYTFLAPDAPQHEQELAALLEQKLQAPAP